MMVRQVSASARGREDRRAPAPALAFFAVLALIDAPASAAPPAASVEAPIPGVAGSEPSADEAIERALRVFAVSGGDVGSLRTLARVRGLLPRVTGSYFRDDLASNLAGRSTGDQNLQRQEELANLTDNYALSVELDLRDLAFNPSEVDVYGLVSIQRDLILEVSRTYYLRQQLLIQRATNPPVEAGARQILDLRIREFTTLLDAFTGGWFSAESARRANLKPRE